MVQDLSPWGFEIIKLTLTSGPWGVQSWEGVDMGVWSGFGAGFRLGTWIFGQEVECLQSQLQGSLQHSSCCWDQSPQQGGAGCCAAQTLALPGEVHGTLWALSQEAEARHTPVMSWDQLVLPLPPFGSLELLCSSLAWCGGVEGESGKLRPHPWRGSRAGSRGL